MCYDYVSCKKRCGLPSSSHLCSSVGLPSTVRTGLGSGSFSGLLNPTDSRIRGANVIFVPYCSSDAFFGNSSAFGLHFHGAQIATQVIQHAASRHGLGNVPWRRDTLIFAGGSAGARGVMTILDYIPSILGATTASRVNVVGILASPLWMIPDRRVARSGFLGFKEELQSFLHYGAPPYLGALCGEVFREPQERWRCLLAQYRLPFVTTPYIILCSLFDAFQLYVEANVEADVNVGNFAEDQIAFARALSQRISLFSHRLLWGFENKRAAWLCACIHHTTGLDQEEWETLRCGGITAQDAVGKFIFERLRFGIRNWTNDLDRVQRSPSAFWSDDVHPQSIRRCML